VCVAVKFFLKKNKNVMINEMVGFGGLNFFKN